jgi:Uma2 family endonuclease
MTLILNNPSKPHLKRWTKKEYHAEVERGAFSRQRIFLYRGELIEMPPMGSEHARCVKRLTDWAYDALRPPFHIRVQMPFETPGDSVPEPDVGIFTAAQADRDPHPNEAVLLVEISDSSVEIDREKASDYAAAGVADYWILDIPARQVIVHRDPVVDPTSPLRFRYAIVQSYTADTALAPLAKPSATLVVGDIFSGM